MVVLYTSVFPTSTVQSVAETRLRGTYQINVSSGHWIAGWKVERLSVCWHLWEHVAVCCCGLEELLRWERKCFKGQFVCLRGRETLSTLSNKNLISELLWRTSESILSKLGRSIKKLVQLCLYSEVNLVSGHFTEAQSLTGRKNSTLTVSNLEQDKVQMGGPPAGHRMGNEERRICGRERRGQKEQTHTAYVQIYHVYNFEHVDLKLKGSEVSGHLWCQWYLQMNTGRAREG